MEKSQAAEQREVQKRNKYMSYLVILIDRIIKKDQQ
jgi:hypothetical protein